MGLGLQASKEGLHIAFSAGTGVLLFIDLVALLVLALLDKHEGHNLLKGEKEAVDFTKFELELYTSFHNKGEAICLDLIHGLGRLCDKYNYDKLFMHYSKLSSVPIESSKWA
jgi:hypothetical protein